MLQYNERFGSHFWKTDCLKFFHKQNGNNWIKSSCQDLLASNDTFHSSILPQILVRLGTNLGQAYGGKIIWGQEYRGKCYWGKKWGKIQNGPIWKNGDFRKMKTKVNSVDFEKYILTSIIRHCMFENLFKKQILRIRGWIWYQIIYIIVRLKKS